MKKINKESGGQQLFSILNVFWRSKDSLALQYNCITVDALPRCMLQVAAISLVGGPALRRFPNERGQMSL